MLAAAIGELDELGPYGGGAVDAAVRREALAAYARFGPEPTALPPTWRHDYAALPFEDVQWSTGRLAVAALPPTAVAPARREPEPADQDVPALAVENAGGLVHLGSTYLQPPERLGDRRVVLLSLADALRATPERVRAVHQRIVAPDADRFTALATAFQNCGAYVEIPAGVVLGAPLQLVWTARPGDGSAVFPHVVVRVGANARATIVERHVGESESFVSAIVEVDLAPGARLDYVALQQTDGGARLFFRRGARCAAGASIGWHVAELGGALVRSVVETRLGEPRARADVDGLFFGNGFAHGDVRVALDHAAPQTESRTTVRSALTDLAHARFAGDVRIGPEAPRCVAAMRHDALVLSGRARLAASPALAIGTDAVSASNLGSVGALDEAAVFYVQSRGIPRAVAERMMALAFFEPAISGFPSEPIRDEVRTALDARLDEVPDTFVS